MRTQSPTQPSSLTPVHMSADRPGAGGGLGVSSPPPAPQHTALTAGHAASPASLIQFQIHTQLGVQLPPEEGVLVFA